MRFLNYARKRGLALFMALVMCLSLLPAQAMADTMEPAPPAWEELETTEIRNLLNPDTTEFTAADLLNNQVGTKGTLVKLGIGDETGIREVNSGEKFQFVGSGIARAVEPVVHAVTWYAEDGTTPFYSAQYTEGQEMPQCPETPSKEADDKYTYAFTGWGEPVTGADDSISYTAIFTATAKEQEPIDLTVTWYNADGSVFDQQTFRKGTNAPAAPAADKGTPSKEVGDGYTYAFTSWGEPVTDTDGNISYTAVFASTPKTAEGDSDEEIITANDQTFSDGGPAFVQLYGVFDYPTDGKMKVLSVNIIETNGTKTPLPTDFDLTRELTLEIDVDTPGKDKEFDVTVPMGVYITNLFTNKDKGYGHIAAVEPKPSPTVVQDLKEYTTLHYTYTDDTARGIFSVKLSFGSLYWNRLKVEFDKAIQITDSKGNELYSAKAHRNADGGIYSSCVPGYISRKAGPKNTFVWADAMFNTGIFSKDIEVTLTCPYDPVTDQYAKFSHLSRKGVEPVDVYTVTEDEVTHTITIKGHNTARLYLNTHFYWEKPLQDSTDTIPGPKISFKGDFYLGGERSAEFTLGSPKAMPAPAIWIGTIGSNIRYNWHEENPDLVYSLAQFDMGNSGGTGELNQMVTFTYNQADAVRVMGQVFPVTDGKSVIKVEYKTNFTDWREYGNIYAGKYYTLWTADLPLQENEYLVATRAIVPPYGAGYICDNQHVFTYGQLKENGEYLKNVPVSTMTLQDVDENGEPVNSKNAKTATFYLTLSRKPDDSTPLSVIKFNESNNRTAILFAGGSSKKLNFTVGISSPDSFTRTSSYIFEPVLFIRLPQGISLVDGSVEIPGISNKDENGIDQNVEVIPKGNQDGFTVYEIHPKTPGDFAAGGGLNKKNAMKSWSLTFSIIADKSSPECTYNIGNMVYMCNNNGGKGTIGSYGSLIVHASSDPIEFDSEAKDTDTCIFDPQTGRVYVSQDGEVKFRFTVKNPIGKELNENVLKNFVYYIPAPSTDVEGLSFKLTGAELVDNTEKLSLSFTKDSVASERSNWTEEYASDAKWIRVQIPAGVTLQTNESASFEVSFQLEGITDEMLGKQFTINCNGRLVSPNADNTEDTTMLAIVVSNGTLTGTLYKDANWDGAHGDDETPYPKQTITAISADGSHTATAETDEQGCYTLKGLRALEYNITVVNPGSTVVTDSTALHFPAALNTADEHKTASTTIDMTDGGAAKTLDIGMLPPCEITFTATNAVIAGGVMDGAGCRKVDKVWYNDPITAPSIEANEGYTFKGWTENGTSVSFETEQLATSNRTFVADCGDADLHHVTVTVKHLETFYDGKSHEVSGFVGETENGIPVTVTSGDGSEKIFYIKGGLTTQKVSGTNVSDSKQKIDVIIDKQNLQVVDADGDPVKDRFEITTVPGYLIIKPRTVTVTSKTKSWPYNGKLHSEPDIGDDDISKYDVETGVGFVEGEGFAKVEATGSIKDIGYTTNTIEYTLNTNTTLGNYTIIEQEGILSVTPNPETTKYQVTVEANSWKGPYDGNAHEANGFVVDGKTYANGTPIPVKANGQTYYVTGLTSTASGKNVTDSTWTKLEGTPVVTDAEGTVVTSEFFVNVIPGYLTIERAAVTLQSANVSKTYDGTPLTNANRTDKTKELEVETGWATNEGADYTFTGSQTGVGHSANAFSYQLKDGTDPNNYVISKSEGTLTVETRNADDLIQLTVTARSVTATYDGKEYTASGFEGETDAGIPAKDPSNGVTYYVTGLTSEASGKDVADSKTTIPVKGTAVVKDAYGTVVTDQFNVNVTPGSLTISKAAVTLKSKDITAEYTAGQPLTNGNYSLEVETGWASGEGATYTFTGEQAKVGRSANAFTYTLKANTDENNYEISKSEGELIVTDRKIQYEIKVKGDSDTVLYDGKEHTVGSNSRTETVNISGKDFKVTIPMTPVTGKDAGTYDVKVGRVTVEDSAGNDVTKQFKVIPENGKLVINKRKVILTSGSGEKVYDGKPLENETVHVGGDGWADDEGATYVVTGSQTTVGSKSNEFEYGLKANTKEGNYIIETNKGQLTVTNRPDDARYKITVVAKDVTAKYDGSEKTADGFETLTFTVNGETYTVSGLTASGSRTDAGSTSINVSGTAVVTDAQNNLVTEQFSVSPKGGTLTVEKRKVILTSETGTHEFDGKEYQLATVTQTGDTYAAGEGFEPINFASRTLPGTTENTFEIQKIGNTDPENYEIKQVFGTLTVTPRNTKYTINLKAKSGKFDYDGKPHAVSGLDRTEFTFDGVTYRVEGMTASMTQVNAGEYPVNVVGSPVVWMGDKDVTAQFTVQPDPEPGKLTITPASLTVKVTFKDRSYNGTNIVEVDSVSIENGICNNDDVRVLFKNNAEKTGTVADPNASTTPKKVAYDNVKNELDLAGMSSGNYVIGKVELGDVTISKAKPTVSLTVKETTYDGSPAKVDDPADPLAEPVVTLPISGDQFDGGITYTYYRDKDGTEPLDGAPTDAGTYYVKASIAASGNYEAAESEIVKLVINPAPLTVIVSYRNRTYNGTDVVEAADPVISGMVKGDNVTVTFAENAVKTGKAKNANAGDQSVSYNGTPADFELTGEKSGNYVIKEVAPGTVTISKAVVTVTANNQSKIYDGTAFTGFTYSASGFVTGEDWTSAGVTGNVTYVGNAVGAVAVGTYTITPVVSDLSATNYTFVAANGTLTITQSYVPLPPTPPTPTPTPVNPTPVNPTPTPGGTTITDEETPLGGAVGLNDTDHYAYIAGYEDDTVRPTKNISRAEVATIFFRLMTEEFRVANWATENTLKDVQAGDWYNNAVSTCANAGIITGYTDGRFQPQKDITRAEFAVIAARFLGPDADDEGVGDFSDTADHWAAAEIRKAAKAGWITGDGNKFRPDDPITRAEVMVIVNRMLDRTPDAEHMLPDMKTWIDNPEGTWYYEAVQEATNGHDYERDELNVETWTAIQNEKNWKVIQAEWEANNGASAPKADAEPAEADGESK